GSHPCPTCCHEARWFPRPFSRDAALDSRPSCSGGLLQGLDERRYGPMPLDPAELALGAQQARHAPPPPHLPVTPAPHARRHPPPPQPPPRPVPRRVTERAARMGGVGPGVRRNPPARPSRTTASVSSNPSRRLEAASALIRSSQRAVASSDALAAS